mmetsp:Transcript_21601/g.38655  ORF Transcript_21601/g.38655 Transcript_21601/m.38655 type:complete len:261 (+) Transcript_21601:62-844(+)
MNPYATVVWLLAFTLFAAYFGIDIGPGALFHTSKDHGFPIMYLILTLSLVMLEVYHGSGTKTEIFVNRVVATITGVLMAVVINIFPPYVKGNDPKRVECYCNDVQGVFVGLLDTMVLSDPKHDFELENKKLHEAHQLGQLTHYLAVDASPFRSIPFFAVDPRIIPLLEDMMLTEAFLHDLIELTSGIMKKHGDTFFRDHRGFFNEVLADMKKENFQDTALPTEVEAVASSDNRGAVLNGVTLILERLKKHHDMIQKINHK